MEENKDLGPEEKKKETVKKVATKKATTSAEGTKKKTVTKKESTTSKKMATGTAKKTASGTTKKAATTRKTTKKAVEKPKVTEKKEEIAETAKVEKIEKIEQTEKVELPKQDEKKTENIKTEPKIEEKSKAEEPKFKPAPKVERKKKKHTVLKAILILIVIALVLFLIHLARNYMIVDSILARQSALKDLTNYSYTTKYPDEKTTMEFYHKDNNIMLVRNTETSKVVIWSSADTKETIFLNMKDLTATIRKGEAPGSFFEFLPRGIILNSESSRGFDFMYWITSEKVNGINCYKVKWIFSEETAWYNKEDGTLVKSTGSWYNEDGTLAPAVEYTDWKFNKLTDEDMSRPNLMGYTVENNQVEQ